MNNVEVAIKVLKQGKLIIIVDDESRENEGDLVAAGALVTPKIINFMMTNGRGLICAPLTPARQESLGLKLMEAHSADRFGTTFLQSVDIKKNTTTGISAADRCLTIKGLCDSKLTIKDFFVPGHVFPLLARPLGVIERAGHTEASVDLVKAAGVGEVAVICEIAAPDGSMAKGKALKDFAASHNLPIVTIAEIIAWRVQNEVLVSLKAQAKLPTKYGNFNIQIYDFPNNQQSVVVLVMGKVENKQSILVRMDSECVTGQLLGSLRCDCGEQLTKSLELINDAQCGVLIYLPQEGRGIGLTNKIRAYALQERGLDTVEANLHLDLPVDARSYTDAAQIIKLLKIKSVSLITNNPDKVKSLVNFGIKVDSAVPIQVTPNKYNLNYLKTKKEKLGHALNLD